MREESFEYRKLIKTPSELVSCSFTLNGPNTSNGIYDASDSLHGATSCFGQSIRDKIIHFHKNSRLEVDV
jgi:hypothetical protein